MPKLIIATRGSELALAQARWAAQQLTALSPGLEVELQLFKTKGDKILDAPLAKVGGKGLFVKEIEDALLDGRARVAVHSMKDMPAELPPGLCIAAVSRREDPRDVLISRGGLGLDELPATPRLGTSSLRRQAQLLARRPDATVVSVRGNVQTRLRKLEELGLDAIVLAAAGLDRLGLSDPRRVELAPELMLPAVGQGALAIETRADDAFCLELCARLAHQPTALAVEAERAFLGRLEGGCQVPIAGHAVVDGDEIVFEGLVASLDGKRLIRRRAVGRADEAGPLGLAVAEEILADGGRQILAEVYGRGPQ